MRIKNVSIKKVTFLDIFLPKTQVNLEIEPNGEADIFDDDAKKSAGLKLLMDNGTIIRTGSTEPVEGPEAEIEESIQEQLEDSLDIEIGSFAPPLQTIVQLKALTTMIDKQVRLVEDLTFLYRYDIQSTDTPDDDGVILPNSGIGRWIKIGSMAIADHGMLTGLGDDDHPQYLLVDGTRAMSDDLDMDSNSIINVADPVSNGDAANKFYVDSLTSDDVTEGITNRYVTAGQEDALAGTDGTPSSTNKFVTDSDPRNTNARTPSNDADIVHISGTESVTGAKTFSSTVTLDGGNTTAVTTNNSAIGFSAKEIRNTGDINFATGTKNLAGFTSLNIGGSSQIRIDAAQVKSSVVHLMDGGISATGASISFNSKNLTSVGTINSVDISTLSVDSTVVHLAGTESITGSKTFSLAIVADGGLSATGTDISINSKNLTSVGYINATSSGTTPGLTINRDNGGSDTLTLNQTVSGNILKYSHASNTWFVDSNNTRTVKFRVDSVEILNITSTGPTVGSSKTLTVDSTNGISAGGASIPFNSKELTTIGSSQHTTSSLDASGFSSLYIVGRPSDATTTLYINSPNGVLIQGDNQNAIIEIIETTGHINLDTPDKITLSAQGNIDIQPNGNINAFSKVIIDNDADAPLNVPILSADPSSPVNGDVWIKDDTGVTTLNVRVGGVTKSVTLV